jgi:hypothetical protein
MLLPILFLLDQVLGQQKFSCVAAGPSFGPAEILALVISSSRTKFWSSKKAAFY